VSVNVKMFRTLVAFFASALLATSALADWQYTNWTMKREQVAVASQGKSVALSPEEQKANSPRDSQNVALPKAPYSSGQYQFTAYFLFGADTGALSTVTLSLANAEHAHDLLGSLRMKYGSPESEKQNALMSYAIWYSGSDQISYLKIGEDMVSVSYQPRITSNNSGL